MMSMDEEIYADRLDIYDFLLIGEAVLGIRAGALQRSAQLDLAESALAAPFAGFGDYVAYPDPVDRAAICCSRIVRNHPLIDGNKRVGYECMREMLDRSVISWPRPSQDAISIALTVEGLAARTITEDEFRTWARQRVAGG